MLRGGGNVTLPFDSRVQAVANGNGGALPPGRERRTGRCCGELTFPITLRQRFGSEPAALQLARPLSPASTTSCRDLRLVLFLAVRAAGSRSPPRSGGWRPRRVLAPLAEVAQTAQHITETEDLTSRIQSTPTTRSAQLATRFNAMIERLQGSRAALDESVRAQRQLVADASHELRTPITSLRTNIEVLLAGDELVGG